MSALPVSDWALTMKQYADNISPWITTDPAALAKLAANTTAVKSAISSIKESAIAHLSPTLTPGVPHTPSAGAIMMTNIASAANTTKKYVTTIMGTVNKIVAEKTAAVNGTTGLAAHIATLDAQDMKVHGLDLMKTVKTNTSAIVDNYSKKLDLLKG
jgi:hypothetical protein